MIAPLRESKAAPPEQSRLCEAHEYLTATLLDQPAKDHGPAVASWKAWALVGWMALAVAFYAAAMLGWW